MDEDLQTPSDAQLVQQARQGDVQAFEALIGRHAGLVFTIARAHVRDHETAEDLMQEVFLRVHLNLRCLRNPARLTPWLARLTRNLALDWLRRGQRRSQLVSMVPLGEKVSEVPDTQTAGAQAMLDSENQSEALWSAVEQLPPEQREMVLLHFAEEMEQREIAERLGIHPSTVSRQLRRALESLRGMVEPMLSSAAPSLRMPQRAATRAMTLVASAAALSSAAKSSLASAAAATAPPGAAASIGPLSSIAATLAAGGGIMATGKALTAVAAVAVIGYLGYSHLNPSPPRAPASAAVPVVTGEPVSIQWDLTPDTAWTETLHFWGSVQVEGVEDIYDLDCWVVTDRQVMPAVNDGDIRVESIVQEAEYELTPRSQGAAAESQRGERLRGHRVMTTVDRLGRVTSVDWGPNPSETDGLNVGATILRLLTSGCPEGSVRPGETWTREIHLPGAVEITATMRETLIGVELVGGRPVARVHKEIVAETGPLTLMGNVQLMSTSGQRHTVDTECLHLLGSNRPLSEEGSLTMVATYQDGGTETVEFDYTIQFESGS